MVVWRGGCGEDEVQFKLFIVLKYNRMRSQENYVKIRENLNQDGQSKHKLKKQ